MLPQAVVPQALTSIVPITLKTTRLFLEHGDTRSYLSLTQAARV